MQGVQVQSLARELRSCEVQPKKDLLNLKKKTLIEKNKRESEVIKHFEESQMKDTIHWMLNYRSARCTICMAICKFHYLQHND